MVLAMETGNGRRAVATDGPGEYWPYVDDGGVWVYEWGGRVPGARALLLGDLYEFPVAERARGLVMLVPLVLVESVAELGWCAAWWDPRQRGGTADLVLEVPASAWESRADEVVGMWAPELMADRMLDSEAVAKMAKMRARTVANYLARGRMPAPTIRLGGSPLWCRPVIMRWLATRPGRVGRPRSVQVYEADFE